MAQKINLKISQRHDVLSNWTSKDPVLLDGELVAVECQDQIRFKLGDGTKKFSEIDYVDQKVVESEKAQFGTLAVASGTGSFAAGFNVSATGDFSQAVGYKANATHAQSFVWSGQTGNAFQSKGQGTFAIDPVDGISGAFVGDSSLYDHLYSHTYPLSSEIGQTSTKLDGLSGEVKTISSSLNGVLTAYVPKTSLTAYATTAAVDALPTSAEVSTILTSYSYGKTDVDNLSAKYTHLSASRYKLVDATLATAGSGLSCAVADQTVTRIVISSSTIPVSVQLPPRPSGEHLSSGARDFVMRIEVEVSAVPAITFFGGISGSGYEPVSFDSEDDSWCVLEPGLNIISFTETKRA